MSDPAPEAGPSGPGSVQAAVKGEDDVVVVSEVVMSSPPPVKQGTPKSKMKQSRLPFAPIQKESAINIQRQKQIKEQELLKAKMEEEQKLAEAKAAKEKEEAAASKKESAASESNSKPLKEPFCKYQLGDFVWAKMKSFPAWPGKIVMGPDHIKLPTVTKHSDETMQCVRFFGTHDHAFIAENDIKPYLEGKESLGATKGKPASFAKAVQEVEAVIAGKGGTSSVGPSSAADGTTDQKEPTTRIQNPTVVVKKLPASAAVTKKRKLSASSDDSSASGGGNRRKSARGNGQDKASDGGGDGRVVVKEANVPEVEIIETLKVKIKPRSTPKKTAEGAKDSCKTPTSVKKSASATEKDECKTPTAVTKTASEPTQSTSAKPPSAVPEKLQNLMGISVIRSDSGGPPTPKTPVQRLASSGSGHGSPQQPPCSPATLEHRRRSVSVQLAKLKVKAMEDKDKMDKAVQDQDFLLAADLKNSLAATQKEMERLDKVLEKSDPEELKSIIVESTPVRKRPAEVAAAAAATPKTPTQVSTPGVSTPSSAKVKKLTPKQQKEREDKAKAREEERKAREEKKAALEKEKEEKRLEKEREKKEREAQKEKERKEREALKEKEKADKEKERMEKEAQRLKEKAEKEAQKEQQKKERELERLRQLEEKEKLRKEKQEEKEKQDKLEKAKQEKLAQSFKSFFKPKTSETKPSDESSAGPKGEQAATALNNEAGNPHQFLNQFRVKKDMRLAPAVRAGPLSEDKKSLLDEWLAAAATAVNDLYVSRLRSGAHTPLSSGRTWKVERGADDGDDVQIIDEDEDAPQTVPGCSVEIDIADMDDDKKKRTCQSRAKLLQFEENERPAYWGTWSKKSVRVGPRRPFAKDCDYLDYDYDSDEDWEEEQDGEDLGEDDDKDREEDEKDMDDIEDDNEDGFFVGHGVLDKDEARHQDDSDDDGDFNEDEEMKRMKMKAAQFEEDYKNRKKKVPAKLKPRVYGVLWTGLEGVGLTEEEKEKTAIVTEQLMSLLAPFKAIIHHQGDNVPITTSFTQSKESSPAGGKDDPTSATPQTPTSKSGEKKMADTTTPTSAKVNKGSGGKSKTPKTPKTPGTPTSSRASKLKAKKVTDAIDASAAKTPTAAPKANPLGAWLAMKSPKAVVPAAGSPAASATHAADASQAADDTQAVPAIQAADATQAAATIDAVAAPSEVAVASAQEVPSSAAGDAGAAGDTATVNTLKQPTSPTKSSMDIVLESEAGTAAAAKDSTSS